MLDVLLVAAMLTGRPGTQLSTDMSVCQPKVYACADIEGNVIHMEADKAWTLAHLGTSLPYLGALAVYVFCHEVRHLRGTLDEAVADRWAVASSPAAARLLGAPESWVKRMRRWLPWWDALMNGRPLPR